MIQQTLSIIKPDAVERNLEEAIKKILIEKELKILKIKKKFKLQKKKQQNSTKFTKQSPFMIDYAAIFHLVPLL